MNLARKGHDLPDNLARRECPSVTDAADALRHVETWPTGNWLCAFVDCATTNRFWSTLLLIVWGASVCSMLGLLVAYSENPGAMREPSRLPASGLPFQRDLDTPLLIMAIHPKCPWSQASIGELSRLLTRFHDKVSCTVLVVQPQSVEPAWADTSLVQAAAALPGVTIVHDVDGRFARQLGMSASGEVILYAANGTPLFYGGITSARGHSGDNPGSEAITDLLTTGKSQRHTTSVYGCSILSNSEANGR
jgi:hypothetical protein